MGFVYAAGLILLSFALNRGLEFVATAMPAFGSWAERNGVLLESIYRVVREFLWVVLAFVILRPVSAFDFVSKLGFGRRPNLKGWLEGCCMIVLAWVDLRRVEHGAAPANEFAAEFHAAHGGYWTFFLLNTIVVSTFVEELALRGFIYKALRTNCGSGFSIVAVFCVQAWFHWGLIRGDTIELLIRIAAALAFCGLREYTLSTWNCFLAHAVHNAVALRQWPLCIAAMVFALVLCVEDDGRERSSGG